MTDYEYDFICFSPWLLDHRYLPSNRIPPVEFTSVVNIISFPNMKNIFAKSCAVFPRKQQVAAVGIPVTRSLSGPITAWSPSAVNSMFPLWELMRRFRACPWASFGPATTKTTTAKIPQGVWQYYMEIKQIKSFSSGYIFKSAVLRQYNGAYLALLCENLNLHTGNSKKLSKQPPSEKKCVD